MNDSVAQLQKQAQGNMWDQQPTFLNLLPLTGPSEQRKVALVGDRGPALRTAQGHVFLCLHKEASDDDHR